MRSKCDKIERLLSDYIDGTLSERQATDVAMHLRACGSCRQEVVDLKKTNHLLENFYVEPEASDAYYARFTTQLQHRIEQSPPIALHQRLSAVAMRLGWHLLTRLHRRIDHSGFGGLLSIRQHAFPYYIFGLTLTMLIVAPLLLNQVYHTLTVVPCSVVCMQRRKFGSSLAIHPSRSNPPQHLLSSRTRKPARNRLTSIDR